MESESNPAVSDWSDLSALVGRHDFWVERVRVRKGGIAIEGRFELPPLAKLAADDQVFVACFVQSHGSIKEMERLFGVSYPTIKARLSRIAALLPKVSVDVRARSAKAAPRMDAVLDRLERGELGVEQALELLEGRPVRVED